MQLSFLKDKLYENKISAFYLLSIASQNLEKFHSVTQVRGITKTPFFFSLDRS